MIHEFAPFLYFLVYLIFWSLASYYIHKQLIKETKPSKVIVIGGGFLALNFSVAVLFGVGSLIIGIFSNSMSTTDNPEQILYGVNLEATKDEILKSFPKGFNDCSLSREREICTWRAGSQSFEIIYFYNQKISQIDFTKTKIPFKDRESILQYSEPTIEPIPSGLQFTTEHIGAGFQGIGLNKMKVGDYYLFGCRASRAYYKGKLKLLGLGGKNFFINECSEETFEHLKSNVLMYESDDYSPQI